MGGRIEEGCWVTLDCHYGRPTLGGGRDEE